MASFFFLKNLVGVEFQFWPCLWALRSKDRVNNHVEESMNHDSYPPSASISVWVVLCSLTIVTKMNKKASSIHRSLFDLRIWEMSTNCLFCVDYLCIYKPIKKTINILSRDIYKNCFFSLCNCYIYYSFWFFSIFSNIVFHI